MSTTGESTLQGSGLKVVAHLANNVRKDAYGDKHTKSIDGMVDLGLGEVVGLVSVVQRRCWRVVAAPSRQQVLEGAPDRPGMVALRGHGT